MLLKVGELDEGSAAVGDVALVGTLAWKGKFILSDYSAYLGRSNRSRPITRECAASVFEVVSRCLPPLILASSKVLFSVTRIRTPNPKNPTHRLSRGLTLVCVSIFCLSRREIGTIHNREQIFYVKGGCHLYPSPKKRVWAFKISLIRSRSLYYCRSIL